MMGYDTKDYWEGGIVEFTGSVLKDRPWWRALCKKPTMGGHVTTDGRFHFHFAHFWEARWWRV